MLHLSAYPVVLFRVLSNRGWVTWEQGWEDGESEHSRLLRGHQFWVLLGPLLGLQSVSLLYINGLSYALPSSNQGIWHVASHLCHLFQLYLTSLLWKPHNGTVFKYCHSGRWSSNTGIGRICNLLYDNQRKSKVQAWAKGVTDTSPCPHPHLSLTDRPSRS